MQQGSSQDLVGPQHTSEDISDAIDVSRSSETLWDTSNLVDSNEFVPSLPLSNTPEWDQWLVTSGNILAENHGPEKDMESGPFMSAYNALDNAWRTSSPPGSNTGRLSDLNVDNPRRSFSQINAYHTDNADLISSDMGFGHPAVGSMMTRTTAGIQNTNVFPLVDLCECQMISSITILVPWTDKDRQRETEAENTPRQGYKAWTKPRKRYSFLYWHGSHGC
jgi:hypothetical protein